MHIDILKRIKEGKTSYKKRKALLIGKHIFVAIRFSNENLQVQIIKPSREGDNILVSSHSRELLKYGWKGSRNSLPASYLTGLLTGLKAVNKGIKECILYLGNDTFSPRKAAVVKGMLDAGITIPIDDVIPDMSRISGQDIVNYALSLSKDDYKVKFSRILSAGLKPEDYTNHFNQVKNIILERVRDV